MVGIQLYWTKESENALRRCKHDITIMKNTNLKFLTILNHFIDKTVTNLTKLERAKVETIITVHMHQRYKKKICIYL